MEFVDDISTFSDLGAHLRSNGCYVANLTSVDFCAKNGVGGCLKTLLRQFVMVGVDVSMLANFLPQITQGYYDILMWCEIVSRANSFSCLVYLLGTWDVHSSVMVYWTSELWQTTSCYSWWCGKMQWFCLERFHCNVEVWQLFFML